MTPTIAVKNASERFVVTESGKSIGSAVIVTTGCVLTCFHTISVDNGISINGIEADIIAVDPKHDLALLSVPTKERKTISLANACLGETVFSVGNPHGFSGALLFGRVCFLDENRVFTDQHGAPGISGAGLFNLEGELVGVVGSVIGTKNCGNWFTIAIPTKNMMDILAKVFAITQPTPEEVAKYGKTEELATAS